MVNLFVLTLGGFGHFAGRLSLQGDFAARKGGVLDAHDVPVHQHVPVFGHGAVRVVVGLKSRSIRQRPALAGGIQDDRQVEIRIAENVEGVAVGNVVHGVVAGVEFTLFFRMGRPAGS